MKQISQNQKLIQIINQIINQGQMQEKKKVILKIKIIHYLVLKDIHLQKK